mgnify:CR=1 FL=1
MKRRIRYTDAPKEIEEFLKADATLAREAAMAEVIRAETGAAEDLFDEAGATGLLPPDTYSFRVQVTEVGEGEVTSGEGTIETTNPSAAIELDEPGGPLGQVPEALVEAHPLFQWFSPAQVFDFALYRVRDDRQSAEDVVAGEGERVAGRGTGGPRNRTGGD